MFFGWAGGKAGLWVDSFVGQFRGDAERKINREAGGWLDENAWKKQLTVWPGSL